MNNTDMKSGNEVDKYAVCVKKDEVIIVGHLPLVETGRFAKLIFYFLRAGYYGNCNIVITEEKLILAVTRECKCPFY